MTIMIYKTDLLLLSHNIQHWKSRLGHIGLGPMRSSIIVIIYNYIMSPGIKNGKLR